MRICALRAAKNSRLQVRELFLAQLAVLRGHLPLQKEHRPTRDALQPRMLSADGRTRAATPELRRGSSSRLEQRSAGMKSKTHINPTSGDARARHVHTRHDDAFRISPSGTQNHNTSAFSAAECAVTARALHLRGQRPSEAPRTEANLARRSR